MAGGHRGHIIQSVREGLRERDSGRAVTLVRSGLGFDPLSGALFVFFSRRFDRARILYFSHNGYWLLTKRLERGRFHLPWIPSEGIAVRHIEWAQLQLILEGIDLANARHRPRWEPR